MRPHSRGRLEVGSLNQSQRESMCNPLRGWSARINDLERNPLPNTIWHLEQVPSESSEFVRIPWDFEGHGNM